MVATIGSAMRILIATIGPAPASSQPWLPRRTPTPQNTRPAAIGAILELSPRRFHSYRDAVRSFAIPDLFPGDHRRGPGTNVLTVIRKTVRMR